jgi:hypothetical protein
MSVRSAAQISSPRNGLSICRIIVFGIIGRAMPAGIGLRIRSTCRVSRRMRHRRAKQLRNVHRNPSRLIFAEQLGRWLPSWLFLEINTSELLPGGVN